LIREPYFIGRRSSTTSHPQYDHWTVPLYPFIHGERSVADGLVKARETLEKLIEPHLTKVKTRWTIHFRGRKRNLKLPQDPREKRLVDAATDALQCLYCLEIARDHGDIDEAIRWAYGFSLCDQNVTLTKRYGWDGGASAALLQLENWQAHWRRSQGGKATAKWTPEVDQTATKIFRQIIDTGQNSTEDALRRTKRKLADKGIELSLSTLRRYLVNAKR
jgi:hypothetical protein